MNVVHRLEAVLLDWQVNREVRVYTRYGALYYCSPETENKAVSANPLMELDCLPRDADREGYGLVDVL